jgi:hypothetical protein
MEAGKNNIRINILETKTLYNVNIVSIWDLKGVIQAESEINRLWKVFHEVMVQIGLDKRH